MTPAQYVSAVLELWREHGVDPIELWDPLPESDLSAAIAQWNLELPDWLRELWAIADGQGECPPMMCIPNFLTGLDYLSIEDAQGLQARLARLGGNFVGYTEPGPRDPRVLPDWFPDSWIPFASFGGSAVVLFADLDPATTGHYGQVIAYVHDPDRIEYVAESGAQFLTHALAWYQDNVEEFVADFADV